MASEPELFAPPKPNEGWDRGHFIVCRDGKWVFADDGAPIPCEGGDHRPCAKCGKLWGDSMGVPDVPDPCLGRVPGVRWACCGHGVASQAYVSFEDGRRLYGIPALLWFEYRDIGPNGRLAKERDE